MNNQFRLWLHLPLQIPLRIWDRTKWAIYKARLRKILARTGGLKADLNADGVVLVFAPEGGITPHFSALCLLARTMKERGHRVLVASCLDLFDRCPVMDMHHLPNEPTFSQREQTCYRCAHDSLEGVNKYGLEAIDLRSLLTPALQREFERAVANMPADLRQFEFDSVRFGYLAAMSLCLRFKVCDLSNVSEEVKVAWRQYIRTAVLSYLLAREVFHKIPIKSVLHYNDYPMSMGVRMAAKKFGVISRTVTHPGHKNIDRQILWIAPSITWLQIHRLPTYWERYQTLALPPQIVKDIVDDLVCRFQSKGSHNYSPAKTHDPGSLTQQLDMHPKRRLLVAYTSSLDEIQSMEALFNGLGLEWKSGVKPFSDQVEWIQELVSWVEASADLQLVVRIHPREGSNKREQKRSQHLQRLEEKFSRQRYQYCRFIWPTDAISSYDLGELADVVLVSFSSIGLELARLGVPVVVSDPFMAPYPLEGLFGFGSTTASYFEAVRRAITEADTANWKSITMAFRWYYLATLAMGIDCSDAIPPAGEWILPPFQMPRNSHLIDAALLCDRSVVEMNANKLATEQTSHSENEEREALKAELRRFVGFLFTGNPSKSNCHVGVRGRHVFFEGDKFRIERKSPLLSRLIPLLGVSEQEGDRVNVA